MSKNSVLNPQCHHAFFTLVALALSLGAAVPARAIAITVSFAATSFTPYIGTFVPQETVTGSFDYNAPSLTSDAVTSLNSVNLTIDGHTYTLADVAASAVPGEAGLLNIGGGPGGPLAVTSNTDDFFMGYYPGSDTPVDFVYAIPGSDNTWTSSTFSQFGVTADAPVAAAPEPASWPICLTGIMGLGLFVAHWGRLNDRPFHRTGQESGSSWTCDHNRSTPNDSRSTSGVLASIHRIAARHSPADDWTNQRTQ